MKFFLDVVTVALANTYNTCHRSMKSMDENEKEPSIIIELGKVEKIRIPVTLR